jgi:hypothetical protein
MKHRFFLCVGMLSTGLYAADSELVIKAADKQKEVVSATELFGSFIKVEVDGKEAKEAETLYRSCACGPGPGDLEELNKEKTAVYFWEDPNGRGLRIKRTESSKSKPGDLDFPREGESGYVAPAVRSLSPASIAAISLREGGDNGVSEDRIVQAMDSDIQELLNTSVVKRIVEVWRWWQGSN